MGSQRCSCSGAGSKPLTLGGPLLTGLLTGGGRLRALSAFGEGKYPKLHDEIATIVGELYRHDLRQQDGHQWEDAEAFLAELDAAAENGFDSREARLLVNLGHRSGYDVRGELVLRYRAAAMRLIAAECSAFLEDADRSLTQERWGPFKDWASRLEAVDTIITFNYDRVLENLIEVLGFEKGPLGIVPPVGPKSADVPPPQPQQTSMLSHGTHQAKVQKLHGSVDWHLAPGDLVQIGREKTYALRCEDECLCIAGPGPSKIKRTRQFESLWVAAEQALREASKIAFIGYRFPPTDVEAARRLLGAISDNTAKRRKALNGGLVSAELVLGDDQQSLGRLAALLDGAGLVDVRDTKFFTSDYLIRATLRR